MFFEWREKAACMGVDPELFFPSRNEDHSLREAKKVCKTCPVKGECLEQGLKERWGVWGGKSQRELRKIRNKRKESDVLT